MPEGAAVDPMLINAEVTATAVVITQDDPRHPDYQEKEDGD